MPQHRQAPSTARVGPVPANCGCPGQPSTAAPAAINAKPMTILRLVASLNTSQATRAVNSASALSSSDAPLPGIATSPSMSNTGARTPPNSTAPARGATSAGGISTLGERRAIRHSDSVRPEAV